MKNNHVNFALAFDCHLFFLKSNVFARKGVFTLNADSLFLQYCLFFAVLHFCKKEEKVVIHCKILPKIHLMECHTLFTQKDNLFVKMALDSKHYQKERLHLCIIIVLHFNAFTLQSYNAKGPLNTKCSVIINIFSLVIGTPSWCTKTTTKKKRVMHGS